MAAARPIATYGRRRGRALTVRRADLMETLLPRLRLTLPQSGELDAQAIFASPKKELWLEIGFGAGEHLAAQAERNPEAGLIGSEVYENGVASLVRHIAEKNLDNIRIFPNDARSLLAALPDHSINRVFILFPDPWPKARHFKRRLIGPDTVPVLHRILAPGGELRVATDIPEYARWTLIHVLNHGGFSWQARGKQDWESAPEDHVGTRYESKAEAAGRKGYYMRFSALDRG